MAQVIEEKSSFDKYMLSGIAIIASLALVSGGILSAWNGSFWLGVTLFIGGLMLFIVGTHYGLKHLRKSMRAREYAALDLIDVIMHFIFRLP